MDLLSPNESHAFQSFLSSIDVDHSVVDQVVASDWAFLADDIPIPRASPGREALEKATKDLMALQPPPSLGSSAWSFSQPNSPYKQPRIPRSPAVANPLLQQHQHASPSSLMSPTLTRPHFTRDPSSSSSTIPPTPTPTPVEPSPSLPAKRSYSQESDIPKPPSKRSRTSPTSRTPHKSAASGSASGSGSASSSTKPTLLTTSQKKANHIQSEQKRRANIRRGYEALCDTVPALREAIRAEEASAAAACAGSTKKRKARTKTIEDADKMDGRAGPRSENIVLQKTIDYIQDLHGERDGLLVRLQQARGALARGHPALVPGRPGQPLWEREWTGGTGGEDDSDDDD